MNESNSANESESVNESENESVNENESGNESESVNESENENENKNEKYCNYKIKQLHNYFKTIDETKSFEEQIALLKKMDYLDEYWHMGYYHDNLRSLMNQSLSSTVVSLQSLDRRRTAYLNILMKKGLGICL